MFETVTVRNTQGVELEGYFLKANSKTCVLHITGFGGCFNKLSEILGDFFQAKNINYLFGLNQGSYPEHDFKQFQEDGSFILKKGGGIFEDYEDCKSDIDAWVEFLLHNGIEEIFLLGHSLGSNKVIYYTISEDRIQIKKIILLAPQDFSGITENPIHAGMIEEAEQNIKNGCPLKILSGKFLGFSPVSSRTFYNLKHNKNAINFSYKNTADDFSCLNKLHREILVLIGDKDPTFDSFENVADIKKLFENVKNKVPEFSYDIIENCGHKFKNCEIEVAQKIYNFIIKN